MGVDYDGMSKAAQQMIDEAPAAKPEAAAPEAAAGAAAEGAAPAAETQEAPAAGAAGKLLTGGRACMWLAKCAGRWTGWVAWQLAG